MAARVLIGQTASRLRLEASQSDSHSLRSFDGGSSGSRSDRLSPAARSESERFPLASLVRWRLEWFSVRPPLACGSKRVRAIPTRFARSMAARVLIGQTASRLRLEASQSDSHSLRKIGMGQSKTYTCQRWPVGSGNGVMVLAA